jgi:hypothetical protein
MCGCARECDMQPLQPFLDPGLYLQRNNNYLHTFLACYFIDLYVPCTGDNLYKTLPIFKHLALYLLYITRRQTSPFLR